MASDGIRLWIKDPAVIQRICEKLKLDFTLNVYQKTGELAHPCRVAKYNDLRFSHCKMGLTINGNLPKYYTGLNNIGPANFAETIDAIAALCLDFDCRPSDIRVMKVEIGHNFITEYCPQSIMRSIITYKYMEKKVDTYRGKGLLNGFDLDDYVLQFYDKGAKHKRKEPLLRVELICKTGLLQKYGIITLADLQDKAKLRCLFNHLITCVDQCLFDDQEIDMKKLNKRTADFIHKYRYFSNWQILKRDKPGNLQKYKARFRQAIEEHGPCQHQKSILAKLRTIVNTNLVY